LRSAGVSLYLGSRPLSVDRLNAPGSLPIAYREARSLVEQDGRGSLPRPSLLSPARSVARSRWRTGRSPARRSTPPRPRHHLLISETGGNTFAAGRTATCERYQSAEPPLGPPCGLWRAPVSLPSSERTAVYPPFRRGLSCDLKQIHEQFVVHALRLGYQAIKLLPVSNG
jgi:hypothetical protein